MRGGLPICDPSKFLLNKDQYDAVIIGSTSGMKAIKRQCLELGVPENQIISSYVELPVESRRMFLKTLAEMLNGYEQDADVAEAGVFEGEFAQWINTCFPNRTLHLFDTFEGFDARDVAVENEQDFSSAVTGEYSNTSIELVMSKLPYPERCKIYKGYFPDTAMEIQNKFCFVNLDLDLYLPTYKGLHFFEDKMTENGVILVHDCFSQIYNADIYKGPRAAVDQFVAEHGGDLGEYPIGDGLSMLIAGKWK